VTLKRHVGRDSVVRIDGAGRRPPLVPTIVPGWAAPKNVSAFFTTRRGGVSTGCWADAQGEGGLNLGNRCGDDPKRVADNRCRLEEAAGYSIRWLNQVHGARVIEVCDSPGNGTSVGTKDTVVGTRHPVRPAAADADAHVTTIAGIGLGVLVADCLPVLLADRAGSIVGAAHAGWRGLAAGVLENTLSAMRLRRPHAEFVAWIGPCIGPTAFEVGEEVVDAFVSQDPRASSHFRPTTRPGKWRGDLAGLAAQRLARAATSSITSADACTVNDPVRFWSYRRDGTCGRMAGVIALRG